MTIRGEMTGVTMFLFVAFLITGHWIPGMAFVAMMFFIAPLWWGPYREVVVDDNDGKVVR